MRVLVCGSRSWNDPVAVYARIGQLPIDAVVVHGAASGADTFAHWAARSRGLVVEEHPARWSVHGRRAGFLRNIEMLDTQPDLVIAFWDGVSRGTKHTIDEAKRRGIPVEIHD